MATNLDLITGSLRLLGVLSATEDASAEDAALGLTVLNEFLEEWSARGIDVGHWPQTDVDDDFPGDSTVTHTVKAYLAVMLAPYFERDPRPFVLLQASSGYERLLREAVTGQMVEASMTHLPGAQATWDIETG
jgi:hypothetical protein